MFEIQQEMYEGKITARELVSTYLEHIKKFDDSLKAILVVNPDADKLAVNLDSERKKWGPRSQLHGIPIIVKDSVVTKDKMPTTGGTLALASFWSSKDAFLVARLREAGAIILAKSNLQELSFGFATYSTVGGQTLNPYATDRQPGGSSGGTAVAIATNMGAVGIGEDTAGSIRVPAAHNSLVGVRPTVGLVSRTGIIPISPSRDTAGPITRTVAEAAIVLNAISGYDPVDPITAACVGKIPNTYTDFLNKEGLRGARVGILRALFSTETEGAIAVNVVIDRAIKAMATLGVAIVDPVAVPYLDEVSDHEKYIFEGIVEWKPAFNEFLKWAGHDVPLKSFKELAESDKVHTHVVSILGKALKAADPGEDIQYLRSIAIAQRHAELGVLQAMAKNNLDALVYPAVQEPPAKIGETQGGTITARLGARARFPSITVPAGFTDDGLPVGIEFLARAFEEPRLIELAYAFEQGTQYRKPPNLP